MTESRLITTLVGDLGKRFSTSLGIDLAGCDSAQIFKWLSASLLFGARISENIVINTYRQFEKEAIFSAKQMLNTGWDGLVKLLDEGGYVRYDFKTATKLLDVMKTLQKQYGGDLSRLHCQADGPSDLESRLKSLGKGVGEVTINIFLRELRGIWEKADPPPGHLVILAASNLKLCPKESSAKEVLDELRSVWQKSPVKGKTFIDFETALVRLGKDFCRKEKCSSCLVRSYCRSNRIEKRVG